MQKDVPLKHTQTLLILKQSKDAKHALWLQCAFKNRIPLNPKVYAPSPKPKPLNLQPRVLNLHQVVLYLAVAASATAALIFDSTTSYIIIITLEHSRQQ